MEIIAVKESLYPRLQSMVVFEQHELLIRIYYITKILNASEFTNIVNLRQA